MILPMVDSAELVTAVLAVPPAQLVGVALAQLAARLQLPPVVVPLPEEPGPQLVEQRRAERPEAPQVEELCLQQRTIGSPPLETPESLTPPTTEYFKMTHSTVPPSPPVLLTRAKAAA